MPYGEYQRSFRQAEVPEALLHMHSDPDSLIRPCWLQDLPEVRHLSWTGEAPDDEAVLHAAFSYDKTVHAPLRIPSYKKRSCYNLRLRSRSCRQERYRTCCSSYEVLVPADHPYIRRQMNTPSYSGMQL